jgi:hypothetical protein
VFLWLHLLRQSQQRWKVSAPKRHQLLLLINGKVSSGRNHQTLHPLVNLQISAEVVIVDSMMGVVVVDMEIVAVIVEEASVEIVAAIVEVAMAGASEEIVVTVEEASVATVAEIVEASVEIVAAIVEVAMAEALEEIVAAIVVGIVEASVEIVAVIVEVAMAGASVEIEVIADLDEDLLRPIASRQRMLLMIPDSLGNLAILLHVLKPRLISPQSRHLLHLKSERIPKQKSERRHKKRSFKKLLQRLKLRRERKRNNWRGRRVSLLQSRVRNPSLPL